jgi:hypothetical protein
MRLYNETQKAVIAEDARLAKSFLSRLRGLMFTTKPQTLVLVSPKEGIESSSIHMWFMRQSIDVIWLNSQMKVVGLHEDARPWAFRIFRPRLSAKYVVECPVGTIRKTKTGEGDKVEIK